jgi:hypothetical protein
MDGYSAYWHASENIEILTSLNVSDGFLLVHISSADWGGFDSTSLCLKQILQGVNTGQMNLDGWETDGRKSHSELTTKICSHCGQCAYHSELVDKWTSTSALKRDLISWLRKHRLIWDNSIIMANKTKTKKLMVTSLWSYFHTFVWSK